MQDYNNCKIWVETNPNAEEIIYNQFDEALLLNMGNVYLDKAHKKEIEPFGIIETLETNGKERHFFFSFDQLSALIDQLSALRVKMLKHTAKVYDKELSNKKTGNNPFKGDNVLETLDNLCKDFSYKPNKSKSNDSRGKRKG